MKYVLIAGLCVALTNCAESSQAAPSMTGTSTSVSIGDVLDEAQAHIYAQRYCARLGRVAQLNHVHGYEIAYDCIAKATGL